MVTRLLELRTSLDPALARSDEATARAQIEAVLDDFGDFIATSDLPTHRAFLTSFLAKRAAEESGASSALSTLVAIGDTAVQVVQERLLTGHGEELALLVARVTAGAVRIVNELIADELGRRKALSHELRTGQKRPAAIVASPRPASITEPTPWVMTRGGARPAAPRGESTHVEAATDPGTADLVHTQDDDVDVVDGVVDGVVEPVTEAIPALTTLPGEPEGKTR